MRTLPGLEPSRLGLRDLADQALSGILQRSGRAALTTLGTVLGVAAWVVVLGLTSTVSSQISQRFSVLGATEVRLEDTADPFTAGPAFPRDAERRARALNGVREAGLYWEAPLRDARTSALPPDAADWRAGEQLSVMAASPGALHAMHARLSAGRLYDDFHQRRAERVCVLGAAAAYRLGLSRLDAQPAVFVAGTPLTVIGIVTDVDRQTDALQKVLVPSSTAELLWGSPTAGEPARMLIETQLGAAQLVGEQAPLALLPATPERLKAIVPPDPQSLRRQVTSDMNLLFLSLAGVSLLVGATGIANTTLVAVLERVPEIGLRRALGARSRHIAAHFLGESTALGTLGGLVGTSLGVGAVIVVAVARQWTPVLAPWTVLPAPIVGTVTGLLAGLYPAWRASHVQPIEALQR
jgi:putative ABC transport system permease protein